MISDRLFTLVVDVVAASTSEKPADAVLRDLIGRDRRLAQADRSQVSRAVFSFYRWRGFVPGGLTLPSRIRRALQFDERFRRNPFSLAEGSLRAKVIPGWVGKHANIPVESLRALQWEPRLWIRARPGQARAIAAELGDCALPRNGPCPDAVEYRGAKDLYRTDAFRRGAMEIQDISSQAVSILCGPEPGEHWWDVCAGEGGKTLHLSDLLKNQGMIWATDRAGWRLATLRKRAARAGCFNYRAGLWTDRERLPGTGVFDGVLVDAPCSGLGTWQRNPHARWTCREADVSELASLQSRLLQAAAPAVRRGGKLVYSVCTLTREETDGVAAAFGAAHREFDPCPLIGSSAAGFKKSPAANELMIWPHELGGNGMFIVAWKRRAAEK